MGFRFQRRIKIAPGVRLNLSKSGISTSVGGRGFTWNSRGTATVGIPGTGLSYRANLNDRGARTGTASQPALPLTPAEAAPAAPSSPGTKRIAGGIVCCLAGGIVPLVAWAAIPLFISGYEARARG